MSTEIVALSTVRYDERTDVIEPVTPPTGVVWLAEMCELLAEVGWRIVEPVTGWAPYTHLIQYGEPHGLDAWGYALAELE